jgi:hypothetical protein
MWTLVVETGKHKGRKVKLATDRVVVGRAEDAQIRVGSTDVSRHHCELLPTAHGVLVNDLGSANGTLVNGEAISTEFLLAPGNTLTVGPMIFRLLPKVPAKVPPLTSADRADQGLSDDEITGWLTDEIDKLQSDTTVVGGQGQDTQAEEPAPATTPVPEESEPWVPPPSKSVFDSIAEEAADIIRRHREMRKAMEENEGA